MKWHILWAHWISLYQLGTWWLYFNHQQLGMCHGTSLQYSPNKRDIHFLVIGTWQGLLWWNQVNSSTLDESFLLFTSFQLALSWVNQKIRVEYQPSVHGMQLIVHLSKKMYYQKMSIFFWFFWDMRAQERGIYKLNQWRRVCVLWLVMASIVSLVVGFCWKFCVIAFIALPAA